VRYEDVVADPRQSFARMLEHAGFQPSARFDGAVTGYRFESRRTEAFRRDLRTRDIDAMTEVIGDQLETLGYKA
jgi:hypothetical protein